MIYKHHQQKLLKSMALFLIAIFLQFLFYIPTPVLSQNTNSCSSITVPLTAEEQTYARAAWQYFVKNYQPATGFTNSTGGYPSGTLWDMGNYLMALNAARWLNLTDQADFDTRLNKFLTTLSSLKLFEDALPNKVYNAATAQIVDYGNNPIERGIGWSALDIGRILAAFDVIRSCHPQYNDWLKGIVAKWQVGRSLKDRQLFGATVLPDNKTLLVQEGRLGYEEYAARGYQLWGFSAPQAIALQPFKLVEINGVQIPVDTRDFQSTNANNYVVSESYILDGIEFGLQGELADFAARVLDVQKRRYDTTGQLTAVTEDNIDQAPYFLYNTVYANGTNWATITDANQPYPQFRSISTKAAFGWHYLFPDNAYAQKLFDAVKDLRSSDDSGYYAGIYEESKQPNKALTGNTNGLILEILYYKARGNRPLIALSSVSVSTGNPSENVTANSTVTAPTPTPADSSKITEVAVAPIPPVGNPQPSSSLKLQRPLSVIERRYAQAAWRYFQANYHSKNGLIDDRSDFQGTTLWGLGDYLAALHAARSLDIINPKEFEERTRHLLGALTKLPLFAGELPSRGYDSRTLQSIDYGGNPISDGNGWSALDLGRMLAALYNLKICHPEYTAAVDKIVLDWSYLRVVRGGILSSATVSKNQDGRWLTRVNPETRLGYEEYAARAFQLWGFNVEGSAVGGEYQTASVEKVKVPIQRHRTDTNFKNQYTVSNPFLLYALEFGLDPQMRSLFEPIFQAQAERYRRTGTLTASATTLIDAKPYTVHSTITGQGNPWVALGDDGQPVAKGRLVSTAVAFAYHALLPENRYSQELLQATTDLYNPLAGFYEGFYETTGKTAIGFTSSTNSMILQSLLYKVMNGQPLIRPTTTMKSPWWTAVTEGNSGRGLPNTAIQQTKLISDGSGSYWTSTSKNTSLVTRTKVTE
ncbi:hypothetical protein VF14_21870 [Nostoc linckia z18]|uniref:DUF3131 domain-containing protein n=2 Tax=Nostoc linckia TaxID=92942 RepID=A0A9Q6EJY1_NOSLI|nr:DUF3131 domain-containing protein [Nostoc linckia]PHK25275.1 hypothetical protein VF12_36995 [Nostoc linckia z15]PHK44349.1 hypothetical protein VF13_22315 [Nostoc linckia z16]PHJ61205.1 hypothetical protein VF05_28990 [Nostoc linckia z3]PHJ65290.1 hypothetical protein VF02_11100 [Nostoc linckia z1]PHJ75257.1 hypothetical protein VF03_11415 [Nostoc linckia z2]